MSRTFVQPGNTIDAIAPVGGVKGGVPEMLGSFFGVPEVDRARGRNICA